MMPPTTLSGDQPLGPKITKFLDGLRRRNKLKAGAKLVTQCVGQPDETLLDIDPEVLSGDLNNVAEDVVAMLQKRADDRRAGVRSHIVVQGEEPLYLHCRPSPPSPMTTRHSAPDEYRTEVVPDDEDPFDNNLGTPKLADQAAQFAMEALGQNRAMFRLTITSSLRREERDGRRIMQLEAQVGRYQEILDKAVILREQLLDRQAERQLEIDRVKQRDQWLQDGFAKIVSLVVLHAPAVLPKFGIQVDPRAREMLFDIVGSVTAARPYVNAMRLASDLTNDTSASTKTTNGACTTNGTTAGNVAATTIAGNGETVATKSLAAYAALAVQFVSSVKDKLTMVRGMLKTEQVEMMDKLVELTDAHGKSFIAVGQAAMQDTSKVTTSAPAGDTEEDRKILRIMDLSATFWEHLRQEDVDKMRGHLHVKAREALEEIRKYGLSNEQPVAN